MYLWTVWWHSRNCKQRTSRDRCQFPRYNDAYGDAIIFNVGSVSGSTGFRSCMPSRRPDCGIYLLVIYVRPRQCFCSASSKGCCTANVSPSIILRRCSISLSISNLSCTPRWTKYVRQYETLFLPAAYCKWLHTTVEECRSCILCGSEMKHKRKLQLFTAALSLEFVASDIFESLQKQRGVTNTWLQWRPAAQNSPMHVPPGKQHGHISWQHPSITEFFRMVF